MTEKVPVSRQEMDSLGWKELDVLLVTGDAFVDHPSFGTAVIARVLIDRGFRTGVVSQPDPDGSGDIMRLGRPLLFAGISSGNMDSMVNHYTSLGRIRSNDAYSPGGKPGLRPDRALLRYTNLVQRAFKGLPTVLGGIEASLRRVSHYDFWSDRLKKSVLLDSKASVLVFGMGEKQVVEIAERLREGRELEGIPGTATACHSSRFLPAGGDVELPSHEELLEHPPAIIRMTRLIEENTDPYSDFRLFQRSDSRVVILEPPPMPLTTGELDAIYDLPYTRVPNPACSEGIPAWEMIRDSITVVRGCSGGCSFCAIGLHQGRDIVSRSVGSVLREAGKVVKTPGFRGTVSDLGGPTCNLYGLGCSDPAARAVCRRPSCLFPSICPHFRTDHSAFMELIDRVEEVPGVKRVFLSSGIRHDVALRDRRFIERLARRNVSGQLRIAPEHTHGRILKLMRKPGREAWEEFAAAFRKASPPGAKRYIVPYVIAAFPGCTVGDMQAARAFISAMGPLPRQVQIFLPSPMTPATAMYWSGRSYPDGEPLRVPRKPSEKQRQKDMVTGGPEKSSRNR